MGRLENSFASTCQTHNARRDWRAADSRPRPAACLSFAAPRFHLDAARVHEATVQCRDGPTAIVKLSGLSPCPFWTEPITHVGSLQADDDSDVSSFSYPYATLLDGIRSRVLRYRLPFPLHGLMVSRNRGESASPLHLRDRNFTCTKLKLSKTSRSSSSILDCEIHFGGTGRSYSCRSATIGSTFVARRAGTKQAAIVTLTSSNAITASVSGSVALTPNNQLFRTRVTATAPTRDR